jgi:hypothetical protein
MAGRVFAGKALAVHGAGDGQAAAWVAPMAGLGFHEGGGAGEDPGQRVQLSTSAA